MMTLNATTPVNRNAVATMLQGCGWGGGEDELTMKFLDEVFGDYAEVTMQSVMDKFIHLYQFGKMTAE